MLKFEGSDIAVSVCYVVYTASFSAAIYPVDSEILGYCKSEPVYSRSCVFTVSHMQEKGGGGREGGREKGGREGGREEREREGVRKRGREREEGRERERRGY